MRSRASPVQASPNERFCGVLYLLEREPAGARSKEADRQCNDDHRRRDEDEHTDTARTIERRGNDVIRRCR
jgi:hypothetical protein